MKIISFFNNKGGVGKTTLTCNIAAHFSRIGKRCLLVDCDPQCNATLLTLGEERSAPLYWKELGDGENCSTVYDAVEAFDLGDSSVNADVTLSRSCANTTATEFP